MCVCITLFVWFVIAARERPGNNLRYGDKWDGESETKHK